MAILQGLRAGRARPSRVAKDQDMSDAEAARQLQRLAEANLIRRDADGLYGITPFGRLVLSQLAGLGFISKHSAYFAEYDTSVIPDELVGRFGELSEGKVGDNPMENFEEVGEAIREAKRLTWVLIDQRVEREISVLGGKARADFDLRLLAPESAMLPDGRATIPSKAPGVQKRVLEPVNVTVIVTEKRAGFGLPDFNGRLHHASISGDDPRLIGWCRDLFLHYWEKGKPFRG